MKKGMVLFLTLLAGANLEAAPNRVNKGYPPFSWDTVPLYAHISIGDGFKQEQYEFLADHFDLITVTGGPRKRDAESVIADAVRTMELVDRIYGARLE